MDVGDTDLSYTNSSSSLRVSRSSGRGRPVGGLAVESFLEKGRDTPTQHQSIDSPPIQHQSTKNRPITSSTSASRTVSTEDTQIVHFGTNWLWIVTGHANTRSIQCTIPHLVKGTSTIETDYSQLGMNTSTSSNNQSMQFQNVNPWSNLYQSTNPMPI